MSVLVPCTKLVFLGFVLCSETMTVRLTQEKLDDFKLAGKINCGGTGCSTRAVVYQTVREGRRKVHCGNLDSFMTILRRNDSSLKWWLKQRQLQKMFLSDRLT